MVHFTIDGSAIATTVTATAAGAWSFTPSGLADGAHTIVASQTDSFGNTGTASLSFTLDTTAPVVAISSSGGPTNQAAQTISGTVDVADAGSTVTLFDNGSATALGTATVGSDGAGAPASRCRAMAATASSPKIPMPPATPAAAARWSIT